MKISFKFLAAALAIVVLSGCATKAPAPYDYTEFKLSKPKSILVLPPINKTPEVRAPYSMLAQVTYPLAESGYYVMPVALVEETFRQNGMTQAEDIHALPMGKLREIFGADAVLYVTINRYGATYRVLASETVVKASARLVDARSGALLWEGSAQASSNENRNQNNSGLASLLIAAVIQQIVSTATDQSHSMAGIANERLLSHRRHGGVIPGPRLPAVKP